MLVISSLYICIRNMKDEGQCLHSFSVPSLLNQSTFLLCCGFYLWPSDFAGELNFNIYKWKALIMFFFSSSGQRPSEILPSLDDRPSVVCRKLSHINLLWNYWTKLNQTWQEWSLGGPLSKLCMTAHPPFKMDAVTKNRNFFNCPLLLYYISKWAQISTAATWQWVV